MKSSILIIPDAFYVQGTEEVVRQMFEKLNPNLVVYFQHELDEANPYR
jgi:hypothetical protein